jgi:hypothetical protein
MERDRERDTAPVDLEPTGRLVLPGALSPIEPSAACGARTFALLDRAARPADARKKRSGMLVVAALAVAALLLVAFVKSLLLRALLPLALAAAAIAIVLRKRRAPAHEPVASRPLRRLVLGDDALRFEAESAGREVLRDGEPFGATLVATRRRDRAVLALSSERGTFYVAASFDVASRRAHAALLARAATVASDESGLEAAGPDGEPVELSPAELSALVGALAARDPACLERIVLSDARGTPLVLDAQELRVKGVRFDLMLPLEWRAIVFQEPFGHAVAIYQGTWIRQGASEVTLVALWPSIGAAPTSSDLESAGVPELDRAAARDVRLLQAVPDEPPPSGERVAVDRLFVPSLRYALDGAPRPSRPAARRVRT